jgi:hypothetical protein
MEINRFDSFTDASRAFTLEFNKHSAAAEGDCPVNYDAIPGIQYHLEINDGTMIDVSYSINGLTDILNLEDFRSLVRNYLQFRYRA